MIKTKSLRPSSGVTAHRQGGRERRDGGDQSEDRGGISNNTMVKQYKALFSYRILQNGKNIYTEHQKMKRTVSSPAVYHVGIT